MSKHKFRILSLDGGGIKGIIPCTILAHIEQETHRPISSLFDLMAGTSTGGIIALGLGMPQERRNINAYKASEMLKLYVENGKDIFARRKKDWISRIGSITKLTATLTKDDYIVEKFEALLKEKFRNATLKESLTDTLVTTYSLEKEKPFYFSSRLAKQMDKENYPLTTIARSTSAAPTYFEPSLIDFDTDKNLAMVDGGVFANNPAILAYSEAKELWKAKQTAKLSDGDPDSTKGFDAVVTADDNDLPFFMLSISCGHSPTTIDFSKAADWRTANWIQPLLSNVFMQSVAESTHYTMQYLMPPYKDSTERYIRLDGMDLSKANSEMDDVSPENIKALVSIGKNYVEENRSNLKKVCDILLS